MHHLSTPTTIQAGLIQQDRLQAAARHRASAGLSARRSGYLSSLLLRKVLARS